MGRLLLLLLLIHVALAFAAIVDCLGGEARPERWSRFAWSLLILFGLFGGPIAWFAYGRPGRKLSSLWSPATAGPPVAPDDDPAFLASLRDPAAPKPVAPKPPAPPGRPAPRARPQDRQPDERPGDGGGQGQDAGQTHDAGHPDDASQPDEASQANDAAPDDRNNPPN